MGARGVKSMMHKEGTMPDSMAAHQRPGSLRHEEGAEALTSTPHLIW
jgi:hypothetical protein